MDVTLQVVLPIFGLIAAGYGLARTPLLTPAGVRGLTTFVFYFAIPCLLFRSISRGADLAQAEWAVPLAYFGATLLVGAIAAAFRRLAFGAGFEEGVLFAMGAGFANTVMLGLPLVFTAFGEAGLVPILLIIAFHSILLIGLPTVLLEIARGRRSGAWSTVRTTLASLFRNPVILALLASLAWRAGGWPQPELLQRTVDLAAGGATPAALFALGASLTGYRIAGDLREGLSLVAFKLLAHPLGAWLLCLLFDVSALATAVVTITAALPIGINVFVLAQQYDVAVRRVASAIVLSTALSILTVAVLLSEFVVRAGGGG